MQWLEDYHINKYVRKYDGRSEGWFYVNPPKIRDDLSVGDRVVISPQGRYQFMVHKKYVGKIADVIWVSDSRDKIAGKSCQLRLLNGVIIDYFVKEVNLRKNRTKSPME